MQTKTKEEKNNRKKWSGKSANTIETTQKEQTWCKVTIIKSLQRNEQEIVATRSHSNQSSGTDKNLQKTLNEKVSNLATKDN